MQRNPRKFRLPHQRSDLRTTNSFGRQAQASKRQASVLHLVCTTASAGALRALLPCPAAELAETTTALYPANEGFELVPKARLLSSSLSCAVTGATRKRKRASGGNPTASTSSSSHLTQEEVPGNFFFRRLYKRIRRSFSASGVVSNTRKPAASNPTEEQSGSVGSKKSVFLTSALGRATTPDTPKPQKPIELPGSAKYWETILAGPPSKKSARQNRLIQRIREFFRNPLVTWKCFQMITAPPDGKIDATKTFAQHRHIGRPLSAYVFTGLRPSRTASTNTLPNTVTLYPDNSSPVPRQMNDEASHAIDNAEFPLGETFAEFDADGKWRWSTVL